MTAKEMLVKALKLLGYTDASGNEQLTDRIMNKSIPMLNVVYNDLWDIEKSGDFKPIFKLADNIELSAKALGVMQFGVAAFIAQSENDGDQQQLWMSTFNSKRRSLTKHTQIIDDIPRSYDI